VHRLFEGSARTKIDGHEGDRKGQPLGDRALFPVSASERSYRNGNRKRVGGRPAESVTLRVESAARPQEAVREGKSSLQDRRKAGSAYACGPVN
jgi:hypothetical protein